MFQDMAAEDPTWGLYCRGQELHYSYGETLEVFKKPHFDRHIGRRKTYMRNYDDNALDLFRIMATIQVFMGHIITHFIPAPGDSVWEFVYAIRGVPILFVLCGFLASKSLENRTPKKWLIGRIARMLPAFWACIIVNTAVIAVFYPVRPSLKETVVYIVTQFSGLNFYTGSWLRGYGVGTPNGVLWTIAVQIQFFIIAPFIHRFLTRKGGYKGLQCVAGLTLVSVACNHLDGRIPEILWKLLGVTVIPYLYFLVFGMMLWYHRDQIIPRAERYRWLLLAVYVMRKLAENNLNFPHVLDGVLYNTVSTLLMALLVSGFGFRRRIRFSADYTYGFYLYHMVFINIMVQLGLHSFLPPLMGALRIVIIAAAALVAVWLSNRFIEIPAARFVGRKFMDAGQAPAAEKL